MHLRYTVFEHDADKPWLIVDVSHQTVVPDAREFAEWAREQWPAPRYTVELEPGQTPRLMG